jgi:signal transduction histidine kinase
MRGKKKKFRVSTGLKDLIGRDLITDDFVAIFELVKNSFDAHATLVTINFGQDKITISDNGKGMSEADILNKWLFVAYSAKRHGIEDLDYRSKVERQRPFAGAKGVGRFSCDRIGKHLKLTTRAHRQPVQVLDVDWVLYERDPTEEFVNIPVSLSQEEDFAGLSNSSDRRTGTILEITQLRSAWDREKLQTLKRELSKLIDPFASGTSAFQIEIIAQSQAKADQKDAEYNKQRKEKQPARLLVNGRVENPILDILGERTTILHLKLLDGGKSLETSLEDRGATIYRIRESNPYPGIKDTRLRADIFFLNRSAKLLFNHRMGLPAVQFGSIFLFRNGFRVFPIGAEDDDFFRLNRRKQQGQRRYLGGRDLIGRVDIKGAVGFEESTSRNQGLIINPQVNELIDCVRDKCVRRLERYVVDISWKDKFDKDVSDISRMRRDESSALIAQLVSRLAATEGVELLEYNSDLVRIVDEKSDAFESSLQALEVLAERTGRKPLLKRVRAAQVRIRALEAAEAEAREAEERAVERALAAEGSAAAAEAKLLEERQRNEFLVSAASLDQDTILNLHHQIIIHAADVHVGIKRMMGKLRDGQRINDSEWTDFLELVSYRNSQILTAARFATKGGYKQQATDVEADLPVYIRDYIENVSSLWAPRGVAVTASDDGKPFKRRFKPIEIGIVVDNLVSNSAKANASRINFDLKVAKGVLKITVADDGRGWPVNLKPLERAFEKGVTTTEGSGLGLYHVRQVVVGMGGAVAALPEVYSEALDGAQLVLTLPQ